jgi:hypothetical protein
MTSSATSFTRGTALIAATLLALGCQDPVGPELPDLHDPGAPVLSHSGASPGLAATGAIGSGAAAPGASRQDFEIDVAWDLTGRLFFRDWSVVRSDGSVATVTIDASDRGTWLAAYRNSSTACADPARGAEFDGMGRLDTGDLLRVTVVACDNGAAGSGTDVFRIALPQAQYERTGTLAAGDVVKSSGTNPPPATATQVAGHGAIGPGTPTLGSDRQEFDFDVTSAAGGTLTFTDYSVLRGTGLPGRIVVGGDPATGVTSFHQVTARCVRMSGTGRLDTGDLWAFFADVCDNANPGTGFDSFAITLPDRGGRGIPYAKSGTLTGGDIVQTGGGGGGGGEPAPTTGDLNVTTTTSGSGLDPDGYTVTLDGTDSRSIPNNGEVTYTDLSAGSHTVALSGVAGNCAVSGGNSRTVSVSAGATASASFAVSCAAAVATRLVFSVQPTTVTAGSAISPAVRVAAQDNGGNTVTTFSGTITLALGSNSNGATLSGTRTVTAVNGVATFSDLRITRAGTGYTLTASSSGLAGATSSSFGVTAAAASALFFTVQPSNTETNESISPAVRVTARDAYGNTATSFRGSMTIAIGRNPSGGTLSGTRTVTAASGVGTFSDLRIDRAGDGYTLRVSASGLAGAESAAFDVDRAPLICLLGICL